MTPTMTVALPLARPLARPVAMPIGPGPDRMAAGVARMVGSILEFTRWPTARPVVRMCMAGVVAHGDQLDEISLTNGARIATVALPPTRPRRPRGAMRFISEAWTRWCASG